MTFTTRIYLSCDERFAPDAFVRTVGTMVSIKIAEAEVATGTVVAVSVADDGAYADLTIDVQGSKKIL